jgi:protease-4
MGVEEYYAKTLSSRGTRIAVITGMGVIYTGKSAQDPWGGALMGSETITQALRTAREDASIEAVIFRVDSPGGSALASDLIWREVNLTAKQKPVIVSHSDVAASGGYYVSMGATKVIASPGTITGSIGVVAGKLVTKGFNDWIGLNYEAIKMGENSTYYYTGTQYSDREREVYWKFMHKIYDDFTEKVAESRGKTVEEVDKVGRGHVWTGARALELGLVDALGGFTEAVRLARQEADIPEGRDVRLVYLPAKRTFYQNLLWGSEDQSGAMIPKEMAQALRELRHLMMLSRENAWLLADTPPQAP